MLRKFENNFFVQKTVSRALVLMLFFLLFGLVEIYNNVLFKIWHSGVFPAKLFAHFLPLLLLYVLKGLEYLMVFLFIVAIAALVYKIVILFDKTGAKEQRSTERIKNILAVAFDLLVPAFLIYILFFEYESGPMTLTYYFYFLSEATSEFLKNFLAFSTLNLVLKIILALTLAFLFVRFRAAKYARHYILFAVILIAMAIMPNVVFLLHQVSGAVGYIGMILVVLVLLAAVLFLLKKLVTLGIYRWLEIALVVVFILAIPANIYFYHATKNNRLNIVHIILDTLRQKSVNETTMPFLCSLQEKGIYFPNSYSSSDNTVTTHNAIYYGKYPSNVGLEHGPFPETTLLEVLRNHEYHTAVVSANGRFCIVNGFNKGAEDFYEAWKSDNHVRDIQLLSDYGLSDKFKIIEKYFAFYTEKILNKPAYIDKKPLGLREYRYYNYEPAEILNEFVKHVVEEQSPTQPLYLMVNYLDPHAPYLAPAPEKITTVVQRLQTDLPDIYTKLNFERYAASDTMIFQQIMLMWNEVDSLQDNAVKAEFLAYCYEQNINYLDQQFEKLFAWFEQQDMFKNTLFIVTSDHGESLGEHELFDHGNKRLYNPEIRVPLYILLPEKLKPLEKNKVVNINTHSMDFFPTIIDLLGIKTDVELNGESLLPYVFGLVDTTDHGYAIAEYTGVSAITDNKHKLILRDNSVELYDLVNDPDELANLAAQNPAAVKVLRDKLHEMRKTTRATAGNQVLAPDDVSRYDAETIKLLKTLGYIK